VASLFAALVHYPVLDRNGRVVTSAITSLDIHDLARSARTYELGALFVVHPAKAQQDFAAELLAHWHQGFGRAFDSRRREALELVRVVATLDEAITAIREITGRPPLIVATSARARGDVSYASLRERISEAAEDPVLIMFGTAFGLAPQAIEQAAMTLDPIHGPGEYNHLSVRAAAAVILDRLCGR
jgi:hypothetical protein